MSRTRNPAIATAPRLDLSATSGIPKYLQLRNVLAAEIAQGRWKPGMQIPTEDELTAASQLSLGTVQRALRALADDGLVVRRHGRGTFVASAERPMNAPFYHCRFLEDDGHSLLPIYSQVIARRLARGDGAWRDHIRGERVLCIERLFSVNKEFDIYTHLYIDAGRFPKLAKAPLAALRGVNFKDLLARDYHLSLTRFSETLRVAHFPPAVCQALHLRQGTTGAVLEIVARDRRGDPVYFQDLHIPPTRRRLFIA